MSDPGDRPPWYADGLRFCCSQCGNCCSGAPGHVWVTSEEVDRIAAHLALSPEQFRRQHTRPGGWGRSLLEKPDGDCEFLQHLPDGKTHCLIHSVRPVQCRTWPFWESNLRSTKTWEQTAADCPGISRGELHPPGVITAALEQNGRRPL